ncbi:MAG: hypothetical protein MZV70_12835 [Desulfobacterales bacterium]|nr:hypothetical protein [Desulfobacterales bacterium]
MKRPRIRPLRPAAAAGARPSFLELLRAAPLRPDSRIAPEAPPAALSGLEAVRAAVAGLRQSWPKSRTGVEAALRAEALSKVQYGRPERLLSAMDAFIARPWAALPLSKELAQIQPRGPGQGRKEGPRRPDAPIFRSLPGFRSGGSGA